MNDTFKVRAWDKHHKGFVDNFKIYKDGTATAYGCVAGVAEEDENKQ